MSTDPQHVFGVELLVDADQGYDARFPDTPRLPYTVDTNGNQIPLPETDEEYAKRLASLGRALTMASTSFGTEEQVRLLADARAKHLPVLLTTMKVPDHRRIRAAEDDLSPEQQQAKGLTALKEARRRDGLSAEQRLTEDGAY